MIAFLDQPRRTEAAPRATRLALPPSRADVLRAPLGLCCAALGFFCFMPYPGIGVGNASAIQAGNLLVPAMAVAALFVSWKRRPYWMFPLLAAAPCLSALKVAVTG